MLLQDFGVEEGSPVDVAKSYMRSLSPWRSPSLGNIHFEKSPSIEMHLFKDETLSATPNYSMPSFKVLCIACLFICTRERSRTKIYGNLQKLLSLEQLMVFRNLYLVHHNIINQLQSKTHGWVQVPIRPVLLLVRCGFLLCWT